MTTPVMALLAAAPLLAQAPLTVREAVRIALRENPAAAAAASQTRAAESRVAQARSGFLPSISYSESWARSNNPVFVFSSLLTQRQFTESNFRIRSLNQPGFLNNFQSQVAVDQTLYDWGSTKAQVRSAELDRSVSQEQDRGTRIFLMAHAVRSYYGAVLARAALDVAKQAVTSAEADARRAEAIRDAGRSTEADVLSIRVYLSAVREQEIRRQYDLEIALAALNEALGLPLDTTHSIQSSLERVDLTAATGAEYEKLAAQNRPEIRQTKLAAEIAEQGAVAARAALLPQFAVRGAFEANRQNFAAKGGSNWLISGSMRWNLFDGFANRARIAEAAASLDTTRARQRSALQAVRLEVIRAWADARASSERIGVADAAVAQAEESLRITKDRYENGLSTVTDLLRNETALLEARTRRLAAIHDQRVAAMQLELAAGVLTPDSEVLK